MNYKNINVLEKDYEKYSIPIGIPYLFSKSKTKYLYAELEKRHPRFSDDFYYFSKNKISKQGLISDVFVIEKSILGKYKSKCNRGNVIIAGNKICENVQKKKNLIILLCTVFFIVTILSIFYLIKNHNKTENVLINEEIDNIEVGKKLLYKDFNKNSLSTLLNIVKNNNGIIKNLFWNINFSGETIAASIENVYPEEFEKIINNINIKTIKYINDKPYYDISINNSFVLDNCVNCNLSPLSREAIRKSFDNERIRLLEEQSNPYKLIFELNVEEDLSKSNELNELCSLLKHENINVCSINISQTNYKSKNNLLKIVLGLNNNSGYENNCFDIVSKNLKLFCNTKPIQKTVPKLIQREVIDKTSHKILGEVIYKSGKKVIFFKNNLGKIEKKEVN